MLVDLIALILILIFISMSIARNTKENCKLFFIELCTHAFPYCEVNCLLYIILYKLLVVLAQLYMCSFPYCSLEVFVSKVSPQLPVKRTQ